MKYKAVMYNLKNGMDKLESIIVNEKPEFEFLERCCKFYGAEWFELVEIKEE